MISAEKPKEFVGDKDGKRDEKSIMWDMLPGLKEGAYYDVNDLKRLVKVPEGKEPEIV